MPKYDTAINILNAASQELGLGVVSLSSAANGNIGYQLLGMLNALGEETLRVHDWQNMEQVFEFTGDGITEEFPLPDDFGRQVNQTQWASSSKRPLMGPVSPQVWSWCQYGLVGGAGVFYRYRILGNSYRVFPVLPAGEVCNLYYIGRNWVLNHAPPPVYIDSVVHPEDVPQLDSRLLIAGIKAKIWSQKGFDATVLQREFMELLQSEKGQSQGAPVISLSGGAGSGLIGWGNLPETGWGIP